MEQPYAMSSSPTTNGGTAVLKDGKITYTPKAGFLVQTTSPTPLCRMACREQSVTARVAGQCSYAVPEPMGTTLASTYHGNGCIYRCSVNDQNKGWSKPICQCSVTKNHYGRGKLDVLEEGRKKKIKPIFFFFNAPFALDFLFLFWFGWGTGDLSPTP